jgi:hypothetical protein
MKETVFFGTTNGPVAAWGLIPRAIMQEPPAMSQQTQAITIEGYTTIAPVVVYYYQIYQQAGGTATVLLVFDRADVPADGTLLTDAEGFVFAAPITAGGAYTRNLSTPGHRFNNGCVIIASTADTEVTRANERMLGSVTYGPYNVG